MEKGGKKLNKVITEFSVNFGHHKFSSKDQMILNSTIPTLDP